MANRKCLAFMTVILAVIDVTLSTLFFCGGTDYHYQFTGDVYNYTFTTSLFDLWIISLVRAAILLGAVLALLRNPVDAISRILQVNTCVVVIATLMWSFNIVKLMLMSEDLDNLKKPWFWAMIGWTAIASILLVIDWILLGKISQPSRPTVLLVNSEADERKPLITSNGDAVRNQTSDKIKQKKVSRASLLRLLKNSVKDWPLVLMGFLFLTISAVGEIFIPYYTGQVIDGIVIDKSQSQFISAIVIMALISMLSAITAGLRGCCFLIVNNRVNIRLRNSLFTSVVNQEIGFFDEVRTGDITSRLTSDITTMSDTLGLNINIFLRSAIKAIGVLVFMLKLSWSLTCVTVVAMPIIVGVSKVYGKYYKKLSEAVQDSLAAANDIAEEVCSSMRTVRSFANEQGEATRYSESLKVTYKIQKKQAVAYAGYTWCNEIFDLMLSVGVLYYGGHLVVKDRMTGGNLVSFILYQLELGNSIQSIGMVYTGLMQAAGASEKVFEYIDRKAKLCNTGDHQPEKLEGQLEFRNVSFSYPTRPEATVLQNLSFLVKPGEVVALVGPSGGGKSSCVNLLEHFYESSSGQILLDGVPIQQYQHKYLHRKVTLVGQEPVLYARSIWENIAYGMEDYTNSMVTEAADLANADRFIRELPEGYETKTGEKGLQLSGGQKQRIAIARALIRNPSVLILDEATSALDAESEHIVQKAIYKNLKGRTVIIIAHRLSTVERADRIIVIDKGVITQQGKHNELLQEGGLYAKLVQRQLLGFETNNAAASGRGKCDTERRSPESSSYDSVNLLNRTSPGTSPLQVTFRIGSQ